MFFKQFYNDHLSHASYLIGCQRTNEALIVDPNKDLQQYIDIANKEGFTITQAVETHIHADYASGIRDIANLLNAHIYVSKEGDDSLGYKNMPDNTHFVGQDDIIKVGHIELKVLHTPGHTPESISFLLTDIGGGSSVPMGLFTGDFLFVGDIGRPDLLEKAVSVEGSTEIGAKAMFKSIQSTKDLPDYIQIWPGHGAGSPCGKALGAIPMSTLGYERENNWAFKITDESQFIDALTSEQPDPPTHFAKMKEINQFGSELISPYEVYPLAHDDKSLLHFDLRSREAFHGGHQHGAINIPYDKNFINQIGFYLNYDEEVILIGDHDTVNKAAKTLQWIGFNQVKGYIKPSADIMTNTVDAAAITGQEEHILDIRSQDEYNRGHIEHAVHIPHGRLMKEDIPFNHDDKIYVHCQSGVRSSIAIGILEHRGFTNIINVKEGYSKIDV